MNTEKETGNNEFNKRTDKIGFIPRFLGDAGKEQEVSRVFAAILNGGCDKGNESQGPIQNHWMDSIELLAKQEGIWIGSLSSIAAAEIGHGHENTVYKDGHGS